MSVELDGWKFLEINTYRALNVQASFRCRTSRETSCCRYEFFIVEFRIEFIRILSKRLRSGTFTSTCYQSSLRVTPFSPESERYRFISPERSRATNNTKLSREFNVKWLDWLVLCHHWVINTHHAQVFSPFGKDLSEASGFPGATLDEGGTGWGGRTPNYGVYLWSDTSSLTSWCADNLRLRQTPCVASHLIAARTIDHVWVM